MKNLLLLFIFTFFTTLLSFGQVPPNDLIQNATLVTESPFVETDVRLDLSSPSTGGQTGCDLLDTPVVYYKFTAIANYNISIAVEDGWGYDNGETLSILYSAPNLNVTDESQLTAVSPCTYGNIIDLPVTAGTNYYTLVSRIGGGTFWSDVIIDIPQEVSANERSALIDLYNNADGANWANNNNWNTSEPISSWHGVTVKDGHVSKINLRWNNLTGTIPESISTALAFLENADFGFNYLSGIIPDFSIIPTIIQLDVSSNIYSFQDLETHYTNNTSISTFNYQFPKPIDTEDSFDGVIGDNYTLTMTPVNGTNVQYQWYKKRTNYYDPSDEPIAGANSSTLNIVNLQEEDMDIYFCKATSPIITDLEIDRNPININGPISEAELNALAAIYYSTNGDNWNNNTNWLTAEPISTWHGITISGNKVSGIDLNGNNLTGTLPPEIGDFYGLEVLALFYGNNISGNLPPEIGNLTELRILDVGDNNFTGEIPASYANLTNLRGFWFNDNQLSGEVPDFVATNYPNMTFFYISNNNFHGVLPDFTSLQNLLSVNISNNHFYVSDFANEFNDYLNLQYGWSNSNYYSPQTTLDLPENQSLLEGEDIYLTVSESIERYGNTRRAQVLQWYKDNVLIPGANTNPYIITNATMADSGSYHCVITDTDIPDFEIFRAPIVVDVTLGIHENELQDFQIYPNPTNSFLYIKRPTNIEATINVYDINGRLILNQTIINTLNEINLSKFQSGMYILEYKTNEVKIVKQIIKQ
ncbi:T9SS type A sorting domain-containing protein [Bizionia arctica]|uniref:Ig-like domain-containing protein n=1 Tax=Bizionia arctica TaxID=1495645 RepID=A0A917LU14_9FLAO|nr:T9SS type A sorting domain-containing protein [Bizionia arctica]GGG56941.1 hypothetical protein GCM10010976_29690 [Bizionia arctica]